MARQAPFNSSYNDHALYDEFTAYVLGASVLMKRQYAKRTETIPDDIPTMANAVWTFDYAASGRFEIAIQTRWDDVAKMRAPRGDLVETLDVVADGRGTGGVGGEILVVDVLASDRGEEALGDGVVVAVAPRGRAAGR